MNPRTSTKSRSSGRAAALIALSFAFALVAESSRAQPNTNERDQIWTEATLMDLRQQQSGEQLLLMHTVVSHAKKPDVTPQSLRKAIEDTRERTRSLRGPKSTRYRNVLRILGGGLGAGLAARLGAPPQIPFVAGTIVGEELDSVIAKFLDREGEAQWRAMRRDVDQTKLDRTERALVETFKSALQDRPDLAETGYGVLRTGASRPNDSVDEILERHPELRQLRTIIETKDVAQRNGALLQTVKKGLVELDNTVRTRLDEQKSDIARLAEEMKSEHARRVEAELDRMKIEGLRGVAFVASTVIGWEDPKLGAQIGTVANAGIDVYQAVAAFSRLGEDATAIAAAALTGNVIAAAVRVIDVFIDTGPTPEEQILDVVRQIGQQVQALHERMEERFDALDVQMARLRAQIGEAVELIVINQRHTHEQLRSLRARLERQNIVNAEMLEALQRQTELIETWFEDMHIAPCLIHGEVEETITPESFIKCRNKIAAAGRSTMLEGAAARPRSAEVELPDYAQRPDDMTNAGLWALRAATVHEAQALPNSVAGLERWAHVADQMDAFLSRWHELAAKADRTATTRYAATMRNHREALRSYTEAVRRELFRHATGRTDNAFSRTFEQASEAAERLSKRLAEEVNDEIEAGQAHWHHDRQARANKVRSVEIGDREINKMVHDILEGDGRTNAIGAWDLRKAVDYIPEGWRGQKDGFVRDLVEAITNALNEKQWQTVRYLLRTGLAEVEVGGWSWHLDRLVGGENNQYGNPIITSWENHPDSEQLYDKDEWLWEINYSEYFGFGVIFSTLCERSKQIDIIVEDKERHRFDLLLKHRSDEIVAVRDMVDGERLAGYAMSELEDKLADYRSSKTVWSNVCRSEVKERFERERGRLGVTLAERLRSDAQWRRDNEAIDLAAAQIKSWLRIALYDSAGRDVNLETLMNDSVTMRSPERAMREGETLWTATRRTPGEIARFAEMLAADRIKQVLREGYGHEGVMRTLFVGIDAAEVP